MLAYALRRSIQTFVVILIAVFLVFSTMRLAPGGPFSEEKPPPPNVLANLRAFYDLDLPLHEQFFAYLFGMAGRERLPSGSVDEEGKTRTFGDVYWFTLPDTANVSPIRTSKLDPDKTNILKFCPWGSWIDNFPNGGYENSKAAVERGEVRNQGIRLHKCGIFRLDFGVSMKKPAVYVNDWIKTGLPATLRYAIPSLLICLCFGIPFGLIAAYNHNKWSDFTLVLFSVLGTVIPNVVMAPLLQFIFSVWLEVTPVFGAGSWLHFVLPSVVLGTGLLGRVTRLTRAAALDALGSNYVRTARAKGLPPHVILFRHILRPAILPVVTFIGPVAAVILTGSVIVETQFQIAGLGRAFTESALQSDYTLLLGTTVILLMFIMVLNLFVDIAYGWIDPRIRLGKG